MKRPQYVFRPNLNEPQHRRAWALLQQVPPAKRKEFLVQSIRVQTVCKLPTVVGILVVLDRIRGTADTIGPPVRPVTAVNRCIRKFRRDGSVQFLQRNHLNADFLTVLFIISTDGFHNLGRRRRIIAENTGHCGYDEIIRIALGFTFGQILVKICMQLIREGSAGVGIFTQTVAHNPQSKGTMQHPVNRSCSAGS